MTTTSGAVGPRAAAAPAASEELGAVKRLDEVVVGAGIEAGHARLHVIACGDDEHGGGARCPDLPGHIHAIPIGQAQIKEHGIPVLGLEGLSRAGSRPGDGGVVALALERTGDRACDLFVIFDDQYPRAAHAVSMACPAESVGAGRSSVRHAEHA